MLVVCDVPHMLREQQCQYNIDALAEDVRAQAHSKCISDARSRQLGCDSGLLTGGQQRERKVGSD